MAHNPVKDFQLNRALFDMMPDPIAVVDEQYRAMHINKAFTDIYGWTKEELLGETIGFFPEDEICEIEAGGGHAHGCEGKWVKTRRKTKSGQLLDVQELMTIERDPSGQQIASVIIHRDIHERCPAENESSESKEHFRGLADATFEAIFIFKDGYCIDTNRTAIEIFGYSYDELIGVYGNDLIAPESKEIANKYLVSGYEKPYEAVALKKDGTKFHVEIRGKMVQYKGQEARVTVIHDIDKRKKAEKALRESEEKFHKAFMAGPDSISISRMRDGKYIDVNDNWIKSTGYSREEVVGKTVTEINFWANPDNRDKFIRIIEKKGSVSNFETYFRMKNGSLLPCLVSACPIEIQGEKCIISISRDIKALKQAEIILSESENRYKMLFESANDAILILKDNKVVDCNQKTFEMFACQRDQIIGNSPWEDTFPKHKSSRNSVLLALDKNKAAMEGTPQSFEWQHKRFDGTLFDAEINLSRLDLVNGPHLLAIVRDITERKSLEYRLRQTQKTEAIATLAGGIAHQFNNALSVISGNLELLEMELPDDITVFGQTERLKETTRRMANLTSQLLAYARGGKYQAKQISLSDFVRDTIPLLQHTLKPSVYVETDLPLDLWCVKADLTQLQMVLSALLSNGSEAIEDEGRIRITCRNENISNAITKSARGHKSGTYVSLTVADTGAGMDEETIKKIFDPFFTTKFHGRGLGMAAVYGIIRNHGGGISVDSELNKGTEVTIYFPAVGAKSKDSRKSKVEIPALAGTALLIEDDEMVVDIGQRFLEKLGFRVLVAKSGKEAIDIASAFEGEIDAALLDMVLPDLPGKEIYTEIVKIRPHLKVIVCSGYSIDGPAQEILDCGAQDFMQKPYTLTGLSEKLYKVLS